jgi:hypothetical protein
VTDCFVKKNNTKKKPQAPSPEAFSFIKTYENGVM